MKTTNNRSPFERRCFGRRPTTILGWLRIKGRPKIPCVVRNLGKQGALVELDVPSWLPFNFELQLEGFAEAIKCEIRHVQKQSLGVTFIEGLQMNERPQCIRSLSDEEDWSGRGDEHDAETEGASRPAGNLQSRLGNIVRSARGQKNVR